MKLTWVEEWLKDVDAKAEQQQLEMSRLRADQLLAAITVLEGKKAEVNALADEEIKIVEQFRETELTKLDKKISWLAWNLEQFIRNSGQKSIALPHGELRMRKGRPKIEVVDMEAFMKVAEKKGLLRLKPSEKLPDLIAIHNYVKLNQTPPAGCALTPATENFSYKTKGSSNDERQWPETEAGSADGQSAEAQAAA